MNRFVATAVLTGALAWAQLCPAHAEFFRLDGRFECLESGASVCGDAQPVPKPSPVAPPVTQVPEPAPIAAPVAAPAAPVRPVAATAAGVPHSVDPLQAAAARIQVRRPSSNDLAFLVQAARQGDVHAIELLAWCKLNAIGMTRDPVAAYLMYGAASDASLPHARDNQRLIYERDLDSHQRQQVLDLANEGVTLAQLMPSAR